MKSKLESAYAKALTGTFKVINPIKKTIKKTECEVHLYIQENALEILKCNGYSDEYKLFKEYKSKIDEGLVWADQDFKCYHHFYNPKEEKGMYGYDDNALTVARGYYLKALKYFTLEDYDKSMFYFGATCHIIQDLTVPQHAKGKLFDNHRQFELYVKENYAKINRFKCREEPIILNSVAEYANYNSLRALKIDYIYKNINDLNTKFYLTALKSLTLAQRTSAGCMIMFYNDLLYI